MTSPILKIFQTIGPQTHNKSPIQESTAEIPTLIIYLHVSSVIWDHEQPLILLFDDKSQSALQGPKFKGSRVCVLFATRIGRRPRGISV